MVHQDHSIGLAVFFCADLNYVVMKDSAEPWLALGQGAEFIGKRDGKRTKLFLQGFYMVGNKAGQCSAFAEKLGNDDE